MTTSAKLVSFLIVPGVIFAAIFLLMGEPPRAEPRILPEDGGSKIQSGDTLVQLDEACVRVETSGKVLRLGPKCSEHQKKPADSETARPSDDASKPNASRDQYEPPVPEVTDEPANEATDEATTPELTTDEEVQEDSGLLRVEVERAIDGDTVEISPEVEGTSTLRLIGLDTPEMVAAGTEDPEPYAEEAAGFTARSLEGREVLVETDEDLKDDYDRLLAYVWVEPPGETPETEPTVLEDAAGPTSDSTLFNETLLREGYARLFTVEPNVMHEEQLAAAEKAAREEGLGLWATDKPETTESTSMDPTEDTAPDTDTLSSTEPEPLPESEGPTEETIAEKTTESTALENVREEPNTETSTGGLRTTRPPERASPEIGGELTTGGPPASVQEPATQPASAPAQPTEPPLSILPDTGGAYTGLLVGAAAFLGGAALLVRSNRAARRHQRPPSDRDAEE